MSSRTSIPQHRRSSSKGISVSGSVSGSMTFTNTSSIVFAQNRKLHFVSFVLVLFNLPLADDSIVQSTCRS